ncbi:SH2 domain-containing protein 1A [Scleropages formosus]|uniref:SH2 domain-containing protein 1A n=1 Tax=Scleropages formosus TaxID=113540 RepID=UPI000878991C|nr:SH2 domain-containing protein 1A-like [Scleropages formosus]
MCMCVWPCLWAGMDDNLVYHGNISKQKCEELLSKMGKEGAYLIRDSETIQGALCLCVYKQKVVYTYRILQTHGGNYTLQASSGVEEKFFETLPDLIKNYKRRNQGLATRLRYSVKRQKDLETDSVSDEQLDYENLEEQSDYVEVLPS